MNPAEIALPANRDFVSPAAAFVNTFASNVRLPEEQRAKLNRALVETLCLLTDATGAPVPAPETKPLVLSVRETHGKLRLELHNRGTPILTPEGQRSLRHIQAASEGFESFSVRNEGRAGQSIIMEIRIGASAAETPYLTTPTVPIVRIAESEPEIRLLDASESAQLSRLFYEVYGYDYIHEYVYYPDKLQAMLETRRLISVVAAAPDGTLLGHVGLLKWSDDPLVYEPALGIVNPVTKSRGFFKRLLAEAFTEVDKEPVEYMFFDLVTNIDFSQRVVAEYGTCDTAIFVGAQGKELQARLPRLGLGEDPPEMDRYSIIYSVIPKVEKPFGAKVSLPVPLGESLGFLLKPLGLEWVPTSRMDLLPERGAFDTQCEQQQLAVRFRMNQTGHAATVGIIERWQELLRLGYKYAAVDVTLGEPGLNQVQTLLAEEGFFLAGFVVSSDPRRLAIRFQSTGPARVAFNHIRVHSAPAKRLLEMIREDYERNRLL